MGILRCKMCGAPIEVTENNHLVTCSYCGSKQTIIDANDEKKTNLFNRANQLRMNCDFDSAIAAYESIISLYPQEPEAYWGLALSKFGIEYVDDPKTKKKIPTIHRSSYEHFDRDSNYLRALEYADIVAQEQYKHEAMEITNIQKSILNISKSEKPFDIFICYKESDNEGKRTRDSVIGQELHQLLTDKGYKVFFSRVTLENKLGTMYEPYIFAALNSAKIMIVIGTKKEYFNAIWVKNEWSRFLSLMQGRSEKYIIPCYRDMDAYEMPEELLGFQAQDLNKLGFIQDLLRGINKLIGKEENKPTTRVVHTDINIEPMLQRAEILIQDKDYTKADEVLEKILNNDPRNSDAYLLKSVIHNNKTSIDDLKNSDVEPDDTNFKRAYQFADEERKAFLDSIITSIQERRNEESNSKKYNKAIELKNLKNYESAIELFSMIPNYKDSTKLAKECSNLINEEKYNRALGFLSAENYASATALFYGLGDYKDSKLKIEEIEALKQESAYKKAKELLDAGFFKDAKSLLSKIEKYKDSAAILCNIDNLEHEFKCEEIYKSAIIEGEIKPFHHLYKLKKSIDILMTISDYKNATELLTLYEGYYREGLKIQEERKAEQERKRKIRNRKIKIGSLISAALVCIITATLLATFLYFVPSANETHLINLINEGKYREAIIKYDSFDDINRNFGKMSRLNKLSYAGLALESRDYERALNYMDNANIEATVHYNADGGTISEESQVFKQYVTISPDKLGYDFKDWKLNNYKINATNLTSDIWLDASYEIITYNISYILNASTNHSDNPTSYTVEDEIILKDPSRTGYTFIKWVDQYNNEVSKINKGSTGDLILRSVWNEGNKHIVTLDPNGGAIEYTVIEVQYAHSYSLPIPTRSGYDFDGWYYQGDIFSTEDIWELDCDVKLTAKWAVHYYKITYELNGGRNSTFNPTSYTVEDEIILNNPSRTGYSFIKWVDQYNKEISKINKGSTGDLILRSIWNEGNKHIVTLDPNGGAIAYTEIEVQYGHSYSLPIPTRSGYDFDGWYYQGDFVPTEDIWELDCDVKLTAMRAVQYYKITYELNGGTNSTLNPTSYTIEDEIILKNPSRTGYTFIKWVDQYNNEVSKINKGSTSNITLTAKWSANKNNLVVISEDESKGLVEIISGSGYSDETITVSATSIGNCVFKGWYHDDVFLSHESIYSFIMPIYSYTLVARFYTETEMEPLAATPVISGDGKTITYGLYPQKNVNDSTLVSALNALSTPEINGWYLYEGEYYAKLSATQEGSHYKFDNGTTIIRGTTYWFKCEPITWNVLSKTNGEYYILSSVLLDAHDYYNSDSNRTIDGKTVYPNNYEYSDIRSWLNKEFYNSAFALGNTHIQTTNVNNGASTTDSKNNSYACNNTQDKVFLPSYQDYMKTSYGFSSSNYYTDTRYCRLTDRARARGASSLSSSYNGYYWTRSPSDGWSESAQVVWPNGGISGIRTDDTYICVRPALSIKIA